MSPISYIKQELKFELREWTSMSEEDKQWYKDAATAEMRVLGILKDEAEAA